MHCLPSPTQDYLTFSPCHVTNVAASPAELDATTAAGMSADVAAGRVVAALLDRSPETLVSPLRDRLAVLLRHLAPGLFFWLMERRARAGTGRPAS